MSQFVLEALDLPPAMPVDTLRPSVAERLARHQQPASPARAALAAAGARRSAADAQLRADQRLPRLPDAVSLRPRHPHPDAGLAPDGVRPGAARRGAGVPSAPAGRPADDARGAACRARRQLGVGGVPDPAARGGTPRRRARGAGALLARAADRPRPADRRRAGLLGGRSGAIGYVAATTGSTATPTGASPSPTTSRPTCAIRPLPGGALASRCSCRSTRSPTSRSTAALPDELALHFLESGIVGRSTRQPQAAGQGGRAGDHRQRRHPCRQLRGESVAHALRVLPIPRDLPGRGPMSQRGPLPLP